MDEVLYSTRICFSKINKKTSPIYKHRNNFYFIKLKYRQDSYQTQQFTLHCGHKRISLSFNNHGQQYYKPHNFSYMNKLKSGK